jgi:hypothetical protein
MAIKARYGLPLLLLLPDLFFNQVVRWLLEVAGVPVRFSRRERQLLQDNAFRLSSDVLNLISRSEVTEEEDSDSTVAA